MDGWIKERGFILSSLEDGGSIPEEGGSEKEPSRGSYSSPFRGRSVSTQLLTGPSTPVTQEESRPVWQRGVNGHDLPLAEPVLQRSSGAPAVPTSFLPFAPAVPVPVLPETPGLLTSSLTPVPLALRVELPSHFSVDGGAETWFPMGTVGAQEHRDAKDWSLEEEGAVQ